MITTILKKELLDHLLSFRFFITLLLCCTLIPIGIYINQQDYEKRKANYLEALGLYEKSLTGHKMQNQIRAKGFREPSSFSIFCNGLDATLPSSITTDYEEGLILNTETYLDSPLSVLFGKVDFVTDHRGQLYK